MKRTCLVRLLALGMILSICLSTSAYAQGLEVSGGYTEEMVSEDKLSDLYEEVVRVGAVSDYVPNNMERPYDEKDYTVTNILGESVAYAVEENTDPNNAYLAVNGNTVQGTLTQTGEMRWYGFILDQTSKISILVQTLADVDADLYVFKLDQESYELNLIGGSVTQGLGVQEYCTGIIDAGIYYFAITAYEGSGAYAFAYYASQDLNYEPNDTVGSAARVDVNSTIVGIIDSPFDVDYYKFTFTAPVIMSISANIGDYEYSFLDIDVNADVYKISQKEDMYRLGAGTHYIAVYSKESAYDANRTYEIKLNKVSEISTDPKATLFMVNESAKIVFQSDAHGGHMYVNGNEINAYYYYGNDFSKPEGYRQYNVSLLNVDSLRAVVFDKEASANMYMHIPTTVFYERGTKGTGETNLNVLQLTLKSDSDDSLYKINCFCSGIYRSEYMLEDLNWATVFINPNTGKVIDICFFSYFYDFVGGASNLLSYKIDQMKNCKYYYPYRDGEYPKEW